MDSFVDATHTKFLKASISCLSLAPWSLSASRAEVLCVDDQFRSGGRRASWPAALFFDLRDVQGNIALAAR